MLKTRATTVLKAATRMRILAERAKARLNSAGTTEEEEALILVDEAPPVVQEIDGLPSCHTSVAPSPRSHPGSRRESAINHGRKPSLTWRSDAMAVRGMVFGNWFNLLLISLPLGFASHFLGWGSVPTFTLNFLALVPLALVLGDVTEDLALRFGDVIGGLLNATFGNVVELILSVAALLKGLYTVVAMSLLGSILSNLLLVLGCCFLFGGARYKRQDFNQQANKACNSLLFLSCIGIIIPTAAQRFVSDEEALSNDEVLIISRGTALVMISVYIFYLLFQLWTHQDLFRGEDDSEEPMLTVRCSMLLMTVITMSVACCSEFLTAAIEDVSVRTGIGQAFLGMIVLPIAGNACEHITAVIVAMENKMDLALGVAVGSSIQIASFAIPFVVLVGWITGHAFTLNFDSFAVLALTVSVIHANFVTSDGTSHWLMGVQLIATFTLVALTFWFK